MSVVRWLFVFALGFFFYPVVFCPLMLKFFPNAFNAWIHFYAEYLRWLGI